MFSSDDEAVLTSATSPDESFEDDWAQRKNHFFILSDAGKPIYSRHGDVSKLTGYMGLIQAIISWYADDGDNLRSINTASHKFVFLLRKPLYLLAISMNQESESQLRRQLQCLYQQIVSTITALQLRRIFEQQSNYDLRKLLGGTESIFHRLSEQVGCDVAHLMGGYPVVKVRHTIKTELHRCLNKVRTKSLIFCLLVANGQVVTIMHNKSSRVYPVDIQLIVNMIESSPSLFSSSVESWLPFCLPNFNPQAFIHLYIYLLTKSVYLCFASVDKESFFSLSEAKTKFVEIANSSNLLTLLQQAIDEGHYGVEATQIPHLKHFVYYHRTLRQSTQPLWELGPYKEMTEQQRVLRLFHILHHRLNARIDPLLCLSCTDSKSAQKSLSSIPEGEIARQRHHPRSATSPFLTPLQHPAGTLTPHHHHHHTSSYHEVPAASSPGAMSSPPSLLRGFSDWLLYRGSSIPENGEHTLQYVTHITDSEWLITMNIDEYQVMAVFDWNREEQLSPTPALLKQYDKAMGQLHKWVYKERRRLFSMVAN